MTYEDSVVPSAILSRYLMILWAQYDYLEDIYTHARGIFISSIMIDISSVASVSDSDNLTLSDILEIFSSVR